MISINSVNLCEDDWGFYVDIENVDNSKITSEKYYIQNENYHTIIQDTSEEYEYYLYYQKTENFSLSCEKNKLNKNETTKQSTLIFCKSKICHTIFVTLMITYFVFCVI
jgi:hypothetical protein